jgi:hypothetical protein
MKQLSDEKYFIFIMHASIKKHTWKVYKRGKGISNLGRFSVPELTLGFTMDVCSTEIYQKCPNFVKNAGVFPAFFKANSMMDFGHLR